MKHRTDYAHFSYSVRKSLFLITPANSALYEGRTVIDQNGRLRNTPTWLFWVLRSLATRAHVSSPLWVIQHAAGPNPPPLMFTHEALGVFIEWSHHFRAKLDYAHVPSPQVVAKENWLLRLELHYVQKTVASSFGSLGQAVVGIITLHHNFVSSVKFTTVSYFLDVTR